MAVKGNDASFPARCLSRLVPASASANGWREVRPEEESGYLSRQSISELKPELPLLTWINSHK